MAREPARQSEMTDEELRTLVVRALGGDQEATSDLIDLFKVRVVQALKKYAAACVQKDDFEDAASEVVAHLWKALSRLLSEPEVEHPWAYLTAVIRYQAIREGMRFKKIQAHEERLEPWHDRQGEGDDVHLEGWEDVVRQWTAGLDESEEEAAAIFLRALVHRLSVKKVLAQTYTGDQRKQNRIEKQITRGKHEGGFIARLIHDLSTEED